MDPTKFTFITVLATCFCCVDDDENDDDDDSFRVYILLYFNTQSSSLCRATNVEQLIKINVTLWRHYNINIIKFSFFVVGVYLFFTNHIIGTVYLLFIIISIGRNRLTLILYLFILLTI